MKKSRVLFIGTVWPEPESSAAGLRTLSLLNAFAREGWEIHFVSPSVENQFSERLKSLGVGIFPVGANDSKFDAYVSELKPDVVLFDRFIMEEQFSWRVRGASSDTLLVLDTSDLHFLRRARQKALAGGEALEKIFNAELDFLSPGGPGHEDALREVGSIYRSDLTLVISSFELKLLTENFGVPPALLLHLPFFMKQEDPSSLPSFQERNHFISIGNFRHAPNADGIQWLKNKIWPKISARLPGVEAHIYGAYPSREMMALHDPSLLFFVKGHAESSLQTLKKYRVNLAALRFGAGIKGKIAEAWCTGTPTVTTPIGAEGMVGSSKVFAGEVASTEEDFSRSCADLYLDQTRWASVQNAGFNSVRELLDEKKNAELFLDTVNLHLKNRTELRRKNFVGQMLQHHGHQSTKYFSKWIEEKNRIR